MISVQAKKLEAPPQFNPVVLTITVDSKEALEALHAMSLRDIVIPIEVSGGYKGESSSAEIEAQLSWFLTSLNTAIRTVR